MKALASFLRIIGLLALLGALAPAFDGELGAAMFAAILGVGLIILAGALPAPNK